MRLWQNPQTDSEKLVKTRLLIFGLILALATPLALADEGMWLYNAFPKDRVQKQYGLLVTQEWLDHLQLSSVRFNNGGSGSFVSADGLAFTNHHVGADCIGKLSTSGMDYMKTGFYAKTQAEEAKCPDLELNVLTGIDDVTAKVKAAATPAMSAADAGQAQRSAMSAIEKDCATSTGLRCDVVTLYSGEVYNLYKYKKYTDVRLVFAPEFDAAFFGGDPDNFTFPRYDLDITFFRIYENDKPVHLDNYLQWSKVGVKEGDLIFVSGHPGGTDRLKTIAQLQFLKNTDYPSRLANYKRRIDMLQKFSAESAENARIAQEDIFLYQNSQKAIRGEYEGLQDLARMSQMNMEERERETAYMDKHRGEPNPWQEISNAMKTNREIYDPLTYIERLRGFPTDLSIYARQLGPRRGGKAEAKRRSSARVSRFRPALAGAETVQHGPDLQESGDRDFGPCPDPDAGSTGPRGPSSAGIAQRQVARRSRESVDRRYEVGRCRPTQATLRGREGGGGCEYRSADRPDAQRGSRGASGSQALRRRGRCGGTARRRDHRPGTVCPLGLHPASGRDLHAAPQLWHGERV